MQGDFSHRFHGFLMKEKAPLIHLSKKIARLGAFSGGQSDEDENVIGGLRKASGPDKL
jgi:hypothetical protein